MALDVYTGVGADGGTVTVLAGAAVDAAIGKAAAAWTGAPLGAPRPGAVLTRVATLTLAPIVQRAVPAEVLLPPAPVERPAPTVDKRTQLFNASLAQPSTYGQHLAAKAEEAERGLATGIVMEPGVTDTQGQVTSPEDVERAMVYWACHGGSVDLQHSFEAIMDERVDVVESWIARAAFKLGDYDVQPGTWLMTTKWQVGGKYWAAIKDGSFRAYSIGGMGTTVPLDDQGEG
jgi:hypothetical protein